MSKKKQQALAAEEALRKQREAAMLPKTAPRLPSHSPLPTIDNFGGEDRPDSVAIISNRAGAYGPNFSRPSVEYHTAPKSGGPMPTQPGNSPSYMDYDPYPRAESMTNRGRYSYASSAISSVNSPRRVRRRKDPTPFNILVIGTKNSGKTCFIDFLRTALALPAKKRPHTPSSPSAPVRSDSLFTSEYLETEVDNERVGVTLWDSEGLEKGVVDFQLPGITSFLESKFEDTFSEEQKVVRAPGVRDTHIHCVFLILDPARLAANVAESKKPAKKGGNQIFGGLDEDLDLNVLRELQGKTTVIPVISKADTITTAHMKFLKKMVWDTLKKAKLDPLEALHLVDDDDSEDDRFDERDEDAYIHSSSDNEGKSDMLNKLADRSSSEAGGSNASSTSSPPTSPPSAKRHSRKPSAMSASIQNEDAGAPYLPLSIISPDPYDPEVVGRKFPWGFADPYNPEHCDFVKLRESVFTEWRSELREASREQWYEGWRTNRLEKGNPRRRIATSDGIASQGLTVPSANGRASSAGSREYRQPRTTGY
ncbi:septin [Amniculicola lignicola CBS 123094]|uniref:Septin n=1 Tax=Amniculicola lignicola CBS 123094 TaxID=1392246 RepID=A0A6A5WRW8_9PLEO|nr:septin [Amniculicola lignicola CBS 123094]